MFDGIHYALRGFVEIFRPGVKRYLVLPFFVNAGLVAAIVWIGHRYLGGAEGWVEEHVPEFLSKVLGVVLEVLFWIVGALVGVVSFFFASNLIAAPFNALIAEAVEKNARGEGSPSGSILMAIVKLPLVALSEAWKLLYILLIGGLLALLLFIPVLNVVAPVIWFLYGAWAFALGNVDYVMDNHDKPFKEMRAFVRRHLFTSLVFGATCLVMALIPVLNFFSMQAAAAGATLFWIDRNRR